MDARFWHQKWEQQDTPFHERDFNPLLVKYFDELSLAPGSRVFVPLCGKTLDISWLLARGFRVAGAELSPIAVEQLFAQLGVAPQKSQVGAVAHYHAADLDIYQGDIFDVSRQLLGPVDAVYDRAALVALPEATRNRYTSHLTEVTDTAPQLLICFEYDQNLLAGPPFSISHEEVRRHYGDRYGLKLLASVDLAGGLKGKCPATEHVWRLKQRA